jgi:hypothetical protein
VWWDSARPAREVWPHARALGAAPVCGRYLADGDGAAVALTPSEVEDALDAGLAVVPIWNGARPPLQGFVQGAREAELALDALRRLGVEGGPVVVADVEASWTVDAGWIAGWCLGIARAGCEPGLYCTLGGVARELALDWADVLPRVWLWVADWAHPLQAPPDEHTWAQQFAADAAGGLCDLSVAWRWPPTIGPRRLSLGHLLLSPRHGEESRLLVS